MESENEELQLKNQANGLINSLIKNVSTLSMNGVVPQLADAEMYSEVGDPRMHIDTACSKAKQSRDQYTDYKNLPAIKWYSFNKTGKRQIKEEKRDEILENLMDAVDGNAEASKYLFNEVVHLSTFSKELYALGLMGVAANRIVVREIKARLEKASQEEIDDLARQELESVMNELIRQKAIEDKIEGIEDKIEGLVSDIASATNKISELDTTLSSASERLSEHDTALSSLNGDISNLNSQVSKIHGTLTALESELNSFKGELHNLHAIMGKVEPQIVSKFKPICDKLSTEVALLTQYKDNEMSKRTFMDSLWYKVCIGIMTVSALICSIVL